MNINAAPLCGGAVGTCAPWVHRGVCRWTVNSREQEDNCHKAWAGQMVARKESQLLVHYLHVFSILSPGT